MAGNFPKLPEKGASNVQKYVLKVKNFDENVKLSHFTSFTLKQKKIESLEQPN